MKEKIVSINDAISKINDGDRIMIGGFGRRGTPITLVEALAASGKKDLTIISNDLGEPKEGLGKLFDNGQVKRLIGNYYNWNPDVIEAYNKGELEVTLIPQGSFSESIRAAGMGIPAYYTIASAGTKLGQGKETRVFGDKTYVLEEAIYADVALIEAHKADSLGNLVYCKTARNFNPMMAMAAKYTIALVEDIVEAGELDPETIVTPHVYIHAITKEEE